MKTCDMNKLFFLLHATLNLAIKILHLIILFFGVNHPVFKEKRLYNSGFDREANSI